MAIYFYLIKPFQITLKLQIIFTWLFIQTKNINIMFCWNKRFWLKLKCSRSMKYKQIILQFSSIFSCCWLKLGTKPVLLLQKLSRGTKWLNFCIALFCFMKINLITGKKVQQPHFIFLAKNTQLCIWALIISSNSYFVFVRAEFQTCNILLRLKVVPKLITFALYSKNHDLWLKSGLKRVE